MDDAICLTPAGFGASSVLSLGLSLGNNPGDLVLVSGLVAYRPGTREVIGEDVAAQTDETFSNIRATLGEADLTLGDIVRVRVYLAAIERDFDAFNSAYRRWITTQPLPVRTTVQVILADPRLLVEIDVVARRPTMAQTAT